MAASDGRRIISGKLVCCGNLSELSDRDRVAFSSLAEEVIDFRTDGERNEKPDIEIPRNPVSSYSYTGLAILPFLSDYKCLRRPAYENVSGVNIAGFNAWIFKGCYICG